MATDPNSFHNSRRDMRSHLVIIDGVLREALSKVLRVERDQMISAQCRQGVRVSEELDLRGLFPNV